MARCVRHLVYAKKFKKIVSKLSLKKYGYHYPCKSITLEVIHAFNYFVTHLKKICWIVKTFFMQIFVTALDDDLSKLLRMLLEHQLQ